MNALELDCFPIDCGIESAAIQSKLASVADNSLIIHADDYWIVSAPAYNSDRKRQSFISPDFVTQILNHSTCNRTIKGYTDKLTGKSFTSGQLLAIRDKSAYTPEYSTLTITTDSTTVVIYAEGRLYIKKHKLPGFAGNRVSGMVDTMVTLVDCGILVYNARTGNTPQHLRDAMRHILTRKESKFTHHCYEWQSTFNADLSSIIAPALERSSGHTFDGTCYLWPEKYEAGSAKGKRIQCRIKIYNISAVQEDRKNKPYQYIVGDIFKFEITFTHEFFYRHSERNPDFARISDFKSQGDIFDLLLKHIVAQFKRFVLKPLTPLELNSFYRATGAANEAEFMKKLINPDSLQVNIAAELQAIKDKQADLERRMVLAESFDSEVKADIADLKADMLKLRADLGLYDPNKDKRKERHELRN